MGLKLFCIQLTGVLSLIFSGLSLEQTRKLAYQYARELNLAIPSSWEENRCAGVDWLVEFRKRNQELALRSPEATSLARGMSFNKHNVNIFFDNLMTVLRTKDIQPHRIFNIDETGITTVQKVQKVLSEKGSKQVGQFTSQERGINVTMVGIICSNGTSIPPAYVFPRVNFKDHMLKNAPSGSLGLAVESGWMTNELFPSVIQHLIKNASVSPANPALLVMDNHASHISTQVIDVAKEAGLSIVTFPPHCSHRLQPLDVSCYGPFKRLFNSACDQFMVTNPGKRITIYDVAELSAQAYYRAMSAENIQSGFRKTGIQPLNRDVFRDDEFLPSTLLTDTNSGVADQVATSPPSVLSLPSVSNKPLERKRKPVRSIILTKTPEKVQAETSTSEVISIPKRRRVVVQEGAGEPVDESELATPIKNDESLTKDIGVGSYVLVKFTTQQKRLVYYVGLVEATDDNGFEILYMKRAGEQHSFEFPENPDREICVPHDDIVLCLGAPTEIGGTSRSKNCLRFGVDLSCYNVC